MSRSYKDVTEEKEPKAGEYRCEICKGIFEFGWSPEEATAEADEHGLDIEECGMVCDPCYKKTPWGQPGMTPEISVRVQDAMAEIMEKQNKTPERSGCGHSNAIIGSFRAVGVGYVDTWHCIDCGITWEEK